MKAAGKGSNKMNTENRITFKEMAQRLNRCPKPFRKYVIEYRSPHICLGRDMLFNAVEVENFLTNLTLRNQPPIQENQIPNIKQFKAEQNLKNLNLPKNRYASLLGLK